MPSELPIYDAIIIGAGISGLTLAKRLQQAQKSFLILEKSRGLGGRLATRRHPPFYKFDHGAQFIKSDSNQKMKDLFLTFKGLVNNPEMFHPWFQDSKAHYFSCAEGMTQLAKSLELANAVLLESEVHHLQRKDPFWQVSSTSGQRFSSRKIYVSAPLPQSLNLLQKANCPFPKELNTISYAKALVLLLGTQNPQVQSPRFMPDSGFIENINSWLYSVADQKLKKVSTSPAWTLVMRSDWSHSQFDLNDVEILQQLEFRLLRDLNWDLSLFDFCQIKRWRYSHPESCYPAPFLALEKESLFLIGDAFGGPHIMGALRSAFEAPI